MSRTLKAFRSIFFDGNFHRIWQIINKSPLVHIFAEAHRIWRPEVQRARIRAFESLELNQTQTQIVDQLKKNGFAVVNELFSPSDFTGLAEYLDEKIRGLEKAKSQQLVHTKDFWVRLSDSDFSDGMTTDHPLVQLSLKKDLLGVVAGYFGELAFLEYILLTYSLPSSSPLKSSQLWHQDHDNDRMIKFFIYLSDVEKNEDGPFTLLPKEAQKKIKNSFFTRHLSDTEVQNSYPLSQSVQIKGRKFSAFLVDTSVCYHMGSRVSEGHSRLMSTSLYVTLPKSYWGKIKNFVRATRPLEPIEQAAVEANFCPEESSR